MHKLIRFLLTPSISERPDIFQASHLAFSLKNKKTPIQNLHNLPVPDWSQLSVSDPAVTAGGQPGSCSSPGPARAAGTSSNVTAGATFGTPARPAPVETVTSVNPRSRPKGKVQYHISAIV